MTTKVQDEWMTQPQRNLLARAANRPQGVMGIRGAARRAAERLLDMGFLKTAAPNSWRHGMHCVITPQGREFMETHSLVYRHELRILQKLKLAYPTALVPRDHEYDRYWLLLDLRLVVWTDSGKDCFTAYKLTAAGLEWLRKWEEARKAN